MHYLEPSYGAVMNDNIWPRPKASIRYRFPAHCVRRFRNGAVFWRRLTNLRKLEKMQIDSIAWRYWDGDRATWQLV